MDTTEPKYFTEFRNHIDKRFDNVENKIIRETREIVEGLAISTANEFKEIYKRFEGIEYEIIGIKQEMKNFVTKEDFNEIKSLIGSYEIRSRKIKEMLIDDHKPRIKELEKAVFKLA